MFCAVHILLSYRHFSSSSSSVLGIILGIKGPQEDKPSSSWSTQSGHRVCRSRSSISSHSELQEKSQLQHSGQMVWSGEFTCSCVRTTTKRSLTHCRFSAIVDVKFMKFISVCPNVFIHRTFQKMSFSILPWTSGWWTAEHLAATSWWGPMQLPAWGVTSTALQTRRPTTGPIQVPTV